MVYRSKAVVGLLMLVPTLMVAACSGDGESPFSPSSGGTLGLQDLVASASVGGNQGVLKQGFVPSTSAGPSAVASGNQTVVNGGTTSVQVSADSSFTSVFVSLAGTSQGLSTSSDTGLGAYFEVTLPSPQMTASVLLAFPQDLSNSEFDLFFAVANDSDTIGPFTRMGFDVLQVGTGDVQVTLSWDADSDVDLHVIDPNGDEVYWANRQVASGGELDLDSNAGCSIDGVRNENITWPVGSAPQGTYTVRVDYWSACSVAATDYTVLVNSGGDTQIFTGRFTGAGDRGGRGSGTQITTFERTSGPTPTGQRSMARPATGPTTKR